MYFNLREEDILLRDRLDNLSESKKLNLHYSLDYPDENWKGLKGFFKS